MKRYLHIYIYIFLVTSNSRRYFWGMKRFGDFAFSVAFQRSPRGGSNGVFFFPNMETWNFLMRIWRDCWVCVPCVSKLHAVVTNWVYCGGRCVCVRATFEWVYRVRGGCVYWFFCTLYCISSGVEIIEVQDLILLLRPEFRGKNPD